MHLLPFLSTEFKFNLFFVVLRVKLWFSGFDTTRLNILFLFSGF